MRVWMLAIAAMLLTAAPAVAEQSGDVPQGPPLGSPENPLPSQSWVTAQDMVSACRHPADAKTEEDCQFEVAAPLAYAAQTQPGTLCLPNAPDAATADERNRLFDEALVYPVLDWMAARPDILKGPWGAGILPAAKALWPCR